jgi:hypothetical protein
VETGVTSDCDPYGVCLHNTLGADGFSCHQVIDLIQKISVEGTFARDKRLGFDLNISPN